MGKYLVIANQTLGGEQLLGEVRRRAAAEPSSFHVVVPITQSIGLAEERAEQVTLAEGRLREVLSTLRGEGLEVSGVLGAPDPMTALDDACAGEQFDEIIISTLPIGVSRWLGMDLPSRAERKFKLPVTTVTARA